MAKNKAIWADDILYAVFFHDPVKVSDDLAKMSRINNIPLTNVEYQATRYVKRMADKLPTRTFGIVCPADKPAYLKHEISHYLAMRYSTYRRELQALVGSLPFWKRRKFLRFVTVNGYRQDKLEEINALIVENDWTVQRFDIQEHQKKFDRLFWRYFDRSGIGTPDLRRELSRQRS